MWRGLHDRRRRVHHGIHVVAGECLGDGGTPDVEAQELGAAHPAEQILAGYPGVDRENPLDLGIGGQSGHQIAAQERRRPGDQDGSRGLLGVLGHTSG